MKADHVTGAEGARSAAPRRGNDEEQVAMDRGAATME
jgi:hypothetical protein